MICLSEVSRKDSVGKLAENNIYLCVSDLILFRGGQMPITSPKTVFVPYYLAFVTQSPGVYALWDGEELIYYGGTDDLHRRLLEHKSGEEGEGTQQAGLYQTEYCQDYRERAKQLLTEFLATNGKLPRCNQKSA